MTRSTEYIRSLFFISIVEISPNQSGTIGSCNFSLQYSSVDVMHHHVFEACAIPTKIFANDQPIRARTFYVFKVNIETKTGRTKMGHLLPYFGSGRIISEYWKCGNICKSSGIVSVVCSTSSIWVVRDMDSWYSFSIERGRIWLWECLRQL